MPAPARVCIRRLRLSSFRNYSDLSLDLPARHVVLTGENGAGKTNILEALSLLSPGRGLRRAAYGDMVEKGSRRGFAVHAVLDADGDETEIGIGAGEPGENGGRRIRINGANAKSADELAERVRVTWLTPAQDGLFTGTAGDRRRFLDRMVLAIDPSHGRRTLDYEKAMRSRNRLLGEDRNDDVWLTGLERQMAEAGTAIAAGRAELVRLLTAMNEELPDGTPFPKADLALEGGIAPMAAADAEEELARRLATGRARDRAAGRALDGPHRMEFAVHHRPKAMPAALCSTGEQKALLVGLILAHARLIAGISAMAPVLLLDEIAAHLDAGRRAALFSILDDLNCQAFMTGTDQSLFVALEERAARFTVSAGTVAASS